jgi:hypothetical protein
MGGARDTYDRISHPSGSHDQAPSPSGPRSPHGPNSSLEYHRGHTGIPDNCDMSAQFLADIGFQDTDIQNKIMLLFCHIRQSWYNRQYNSFGPQKESILKSTAFSTRLLLKKIDASSMVNWYERLTSTCKAFRIGLVPFDAIQFSRRQDGLRIPGLSLNRYWDMQSALCTALHLCLAQADNRVKAMIAGVETKTQNGYEILRNLLYHFIPGFNPTNTINKPTLDGEGGNVIGYAATFNLYFRLSSKRGNRQTDVEQSILLLKGITACNLSQIIEPLIIAVKSTQSKIDEDGGYCDGYLPHYLWINELTQKIAERCKVEPFDWDLGGRPPIHNFMSDINATTPALDWEDNATRYAKSIDGHMQGYLVPTAAQACRPNSQPGRRMPNTAYTRKLDPARHMHLDQPWVICNTCSKKGHSANTCDFLAMSIFLQRFLRNGIANKDTIAYAERRWVKRAKESIGPHGATPSKVHRAYAEHSSLTLEQMEDEIDWLCWPADLEE